jgi:hypothetical protein
MLLPDLPQTTEVTAAASAAARSLLAEQRYLLHAVGTWFDLGGGCRGAVRRPAPLAEQRQLGMNKTAGTQRVCTATCRCNTHLRELCVNVCDTFSATE